jgi:hypothetical protein
LPESGDSDQNRQYSFIGTLIAGLFAPFIISYYLATQDDSKARWIAASLVLAAGIVAFIFHVHFKAHWCIFLLVGVGLIQGTVFYNGCLATNGKLKSIKLLSILWLAAVVAWCVLSLSCGHFAFHWILLSFISCIIIAGVLGIIKAECTILQLACIGTVLVIIYGAARWLG